MTVTYTALITLEQDDAPTDDLSDYLASSIDHELWYIESKVRHIGPRGVEVTRNEDTK